MTWQTDAELAGTLYRKSKVYTAMLIARCVEPGAGQGTRTDFGSNGPKLQNGEKVSSTTCSGCSDIPREGADPCLRTWHAMPTAGLVPPRDELTPGTDVDLPDMKQWKHYYGEANGTKQVTEKEAPKTLPKPEEVPEEELGEPVGSERTRSVGRYVVRECRSGRAS